MTEIERKRAELQQALDSNKSISERNKMGQFSTPYSLAHQISSYMKLYTGDTIESFLEPSIGTGVFYSSLSEVAHIDTAIGYEIDSYYYNHAKELWRNHKIELINQDFLEATPDKKYSLIIANPPYTRHHHIAPKTKAVLSEKIKKLYNLKISGLAGLHIYFAILSTEWLKDNGYSCWLMPSEFLSVNYGVEFKDFLLNQVDLIAIHSFSHTDLQFDDALVSSSILVFRKCKEHREYVTFSWGSDINNPYKSIKVRKTDLNPKDKWNKELLLNRDKYAASNITIGTFFNIKRGIATGDNNFFVIDKSVREMYNIPRNVLTPLIPPPRKLKTDIYTTEDSSLDNLYLITCYDSMERIKEKYSGLYDYIKKGIADGVNLRANCKSRTPWYGLEKRDCAPILVSYMGRDNGASDLPVRFVLNQANVTATNSYLCLYLKEEYKRNINKEIYKTIWQVLCSIPKQILLAHGRMYGGGLLKWEPRELGSVPCPELANYLKSIQPTLFDVI